MFEEKRPSGPLGAIQSWLYCEPCSPRGSVLIVGGEKFKCNQCQREFTSQEKLELHTAREHQELKNPEQLLEKCNQVIWDELNSDGQDSALRNKAKLALGYLGVVAKREQTASARDATNFMMARELADDKEQLERYIRATMPSSRIIKELPAKVN